MDLSTIQSFLNSPGFANVTSLLKKPVPAPSAPQPVASAMVPTALQAPARGMSQMTMVGIGLAVVAVVGVLFAVIKK